MTLINYKAQSENKIKCFNKNKIKCFDKKQSKISNFEQAKNVLLNNTFWGPSDQTFTASLKF